MKDAKGYDITPGPVGHFTVPAPAPAPVPRSALVTQRFALTISCAKSTTWDADHKKILAALTRQVELYVNQVTCGPLPIVELVKVEHSNPS